jgi:hypothetical protein
MSSPRGGYHSSTSNGSSSHCSTYNGSSYSTPNNANAAVAAASVFGNTSPGFLNGMSNLMNSAFGGVGHFGLGVAK